ncbi:MAG TPA: hypothetical protein VIB38_00760 [Aestuariivirgaceae bacterium]|jgi:hypothetical protein
MRNAILTAALALPLFVLGTTPSLAQVDVDIDLGGPGIYRDYDDDDDYRRRGRLRCSEARELLSDRGYRRIRTIDCAGRVYRFSGIRRDNRYILSVNSRNGAISRRLAD